MAIRLEDLSPWAQQQAINKMLAKEREKAARNAHKRKKTEGVCNDTPKAKEAPQIAPIAFKDELKITVRLAPVTKKNSQRFVKRGSRTIPIPSKPYENYQKAAENELGSYIGLNIRYPLEMTCLFYMKTRRAVDLTNLLEAIDDVLVHYKVIEDDNNRIIVSHDGSRVLYDKDDPRTEITIRRWTS